MRTGGRFHPRQRNASLGTYRAQPQVRFRGEADMHGQAKPAKSVENNPQRSFAELGTDTQYFLSQVIFGLPSNVKSSAADENIPQHYLALAE